MVSSRRRRSNGDANDRHDPKVKPSENTNAAGISEESNQDSTDAIGPSPEKKQKVEEKKVSDKDTQQVDKEDMAWICAECKEAECGLVGSEGASGDFLICDGPCHRIFHIPCAGLTQAPSTDDDWLCQDCSRKEHACAYCGEYGTDNVNVFPCKERNCGLFFHEACLRLHHVDYTYANDSSSELHDTRGSTASDDDDEEAGGSRIPIFSCHAHQCWTCTQKDMIKLEKEERALEKRNAEKSKKKGKSSRKKGKKNTSIFQCKPGRLYRCLYCPRAYHITCIPPTARFHELALLCHEHATTHKLPELDMNDSIQSKVESKIDQTLMRLHGFGRPRKERKDTIGWLRLSGRRGLSTNPFLPGLRGDRFNAMERNLLNHAKSATVAQSLELPPSEEGKSQKITVKPSSTISMILDGNLPFCLPIDIKDEVYSKPPSYTHIQSLKYGDVNNRPKKIEGPSREDQEKCKCTGSSCGDDCFNRITMSECVGPMNCNLGTKDCGNRGLGKRQFVKCQPKRERGKGWGLVTLENIAKNKLVQEYVGEVIHEKEKEERLRLWNQDHPHDPNFYVMALSGGYYVDARLFANQSRFINHSCAPNCKVMSINVKGRIRNGIYSIRDIKAGEFLSYDYHFDTKQGDRFVCRCGAPNCRGTMKGGKKEDNGSKEASSWKEILARYEADKRFMKEMEGKDVVTLKDGIQPGAENSTETIARGPLQKDRAPAIKGRIFLWRNVKLGANFESRYARLGRSSGYPA